MERLYKWNELFSCINTKIMSQMLTMDGCFISNVHFPPFRKLTDVCIYLTDHSELEEEPFELSLKSACIIFGSALLFF